MDTSHIDIPEHLKEFVVMRVAEGGFSSVSEYIGELIRADQKKKARAVLEAEVLQGIRSPKAPMTGKDWADIRDEVFRRCEAREAKEGKSR